VLMHIQACKARRGSSRPVRTRGFTMIELMITVALVAVLAAIAFPSFREFSARMAVTENTNNLIGALNTARTEAVKRGRPAAVIANGGDWSQGWQVVVSKETATGVEATPTSPGATSAACTAYLDNAVVPASTVPLCLRHQDALDDGYRILGSGTQVVFTAMGGLQGGGAGFDFSVCRPAGYADALQSRWIHVGASGTLESHRDTTSSPAGACG
ncbi:MAG: GspH/FimT family pseudopilin, partial [Rhodanobacteraceae bacterium]|nr:GspH/FimT family pseudopilin [Rhodanobacteraceae bacterium]